MFGDEEEIRYRIASLEEMYGGGKGHKGEEIHGDTLLLQVLTGLVNLEAANQILNNIRRVLNKYKNPILEQLQDHIRKELQPHIVEALCYYPLVFVVAHSHKKQILKAKIDTKGIENDIQERGGERRVML